MAAELRLAGNTRCEAHGWGPAPTRAPPGESAVTDPGDYKLVTRDVRKTYGPVVALDGADIEMREGEFLTLLGPSGSGKTTLLMAIAGPQRPRSR